MPGALVYSLPGFVPPFLTTKLMAMRDRYTSSLSGFLLDCRASGSGLVAGTTAPGVQDASNIGAMMVAGTEHETA